MPERTRLYDTVVAWWDAIEVIITIFNSLSYCDQVYFISSR